MQVNQFEMGSKEHYAGLTSQERMLMEDMGLYTLHDAFVLSGYDGYYTTDEMLDVISRESAPCRYDGVQGMSWKGLFWTGELTEDDLIEKMIIEKKCSTASNRNRIISAFFRKWRGILNARINSKSSD